VAVPEAARLPARQPGASAGRLGRNDEIFASDGEISLLDGGHFLLESQLDATALVIGRFLEKTLS
jgi:hypothetical protein